MGFSFGNAGFELPLKAWINDGLMAIFFLIVGKPMGICLFCWIAVRTGLASLLSDVSWTQMIGAGCLAGVDFSMSIFISTSTFDGELLNSVKLSALIASIVAAVLGMMILAKAPRRA